MCRRQGVILFLFLNFCFSESWSQDGVQAANESYVKLYNRMQFLQEEVLRLQGEVDKLRNQADILKKQHLQDYIDLDKRLRALESGVSAAKVAQPQQAPEPGVMKGRAPKVASKGVDSYAQYKLAYSLIKDKKFSEAKEAFDQFIADYPNDQLVANCYYWLGELYILDKNPAQAEKAFNLIVDRYPQHNKTPEAMYKLGRLYFDAGDKKKARQQMERVLELYHGKSINAVRLANDFLKTHY